MLGLILCHSDVYPRQIKPELKEVLNGVPSKVLLEFFCYVNSKLYLSPYNPNVQRELLHMLLRRQSQEFVREISFGLAKQYRITKSLNVFDIYSAMKIINYAIENKNDIDAPDSTPENEYAILMSILITNEQHNIDFKVDVKGIEDDLERFCRLSWPNLVSTSQHRLNHNFLIETYKCATFLEYIQANPKIEKHFMEWCGISSSEDLIKFAYQILSLYMQSGFNKTTGNFNYRMSYALEEGNPVLAKYCLDFENYSPKDFHSKDFNTLRSFPIIKLGKDRYVIPNWNFILDKMNTGLVFDLFYRTDLGKNYIGANGTPSFSEFKSKIGYYYAEKLFQDTLSNIAKRPEDIYIKGNPADTSNGDLYIRRKNRIAFIEFKDALMVKASTYEEIKEEIDKKLNGKKGVKQLQKLIDKLKANLDTFDPNVSKTTSKNRIVVYPVIVVSEELFSAAPGVNQYLNREFKKILAASNYPFYIKPLVIIEFGFFLSNYDSFRSNDIDFFDCLEKYYSAYLRSRRNAKLNRPLNVILKKYNGFSAQIWSSIPSKRIKTNTKRLHSLASITIEKLKLTSEKKQTI
jgi:hypothetical protein